MGYNISEAVQLMREGKRVTRGSWGSENPSYLVLIPGRALKASYEPMTNHLGEGTAFHVRDHVDAIYMNEGLADPTCQVGYEFTQDDVLSQDWYPL